MKFITNWASEFLQSSWTRGFWQSSEEMQKKQNAQKEFLREANELLKKITDPDSMLTEAAFRIHFLHFENYAIYPAFMDDMLEFLNYLPIEYQECADSCLQEMASLDKEAVKDVLTHNTRKPKRITSTDIGTTVDLANSGPASAFYEPHVLTNSDGSSVVLYQREKNGALYARGYDVYDQPTIGETSISQSANCSDASIVQLENGDYRICWRDPVQKRAITRSFDRNLIARGNAQFLDSAPGTSGITQVSLGNNSTMPIMTSNNNVMACIVDGSGSISAEFPVNANINGTTGEPAAAVFPPTGEVVVAWSSNNGTSIVYNVINPNTQQLRGNDTEIASGPNSQPSVACTYTRWAVATKTSGGVRVILINPTSRAFNTFTPQAYYPSQASNPRVLDVGDNSILLTLQEKTPDSQYFPTIQQIDQNGFLKGSVVRMANDSPRPNMPIFSRSSPTRITTLTWVQVDFGDNSTNIRRAPINGVAQPATTALPTTNTPGTTGLQTSAEQTTAFGTTARPTTGIATTAENTSGILTTAKGTTNEVTTDTGSTTANRVNETVPNFGSTATFTDMNSSPAIGNGNTASVNTAYIALGVIGFALIGLGATGYAMWRFIWGNKSKNKNVESADIPLTDPIEKEFAENNLTFDDEGVKQLFYNYISTNFVNINTGLDPAVSAQQALFYIARKFFPNRTTKLTIYDFIFLQLNSAPVKDFLDGKIDLDSPIQINQLTTDVLLANALGVVKPTDNKTSIVDYHTMPAPNNTDDTIANDNDDYAPAQKPKENRLIKLNTDIVIEFQNNTRLGDGNSSVVKGGRRMDTQEKERVAVKKIRDPNKFNSEIDTFEKTKDIDSPYRAKTLGYAKYMGHHKGKDTAEKLAMAQTYLNHGNGTNLIASKPWKDMSPAQRDESIVGFAEDLLLGLEIYLQRHFWHLDLKPDNFMLDTNTVDKKKKLRAVWIDEGYGQTSETGIITYSTGHTSYFSPQRVDAMRTLTLESANGEIREVNGKVVKVTKVTEKSYFNKAYFLAAKDQCWSMGVILFELRTGINPFFTGLHNHPGIAGYSNWINKGTPDFYKNMLAAMEENYDWFKTPTDTLGQIIKGFLNFNADQRLTIQEARELLAKPNLVVKKSKEEESEEEEVLQTMHP